MEANMNILEGAQYRLRVKLTSETGEALPPANFRVYGGAFCPGFAPAHFHAERTAEEWVLTMPGLKPGRVPWNWQVIAAEYATGVEWLLAGGEVTVTPRHATGSAAVDPGELNVLATLDKTTLKMTVQLGESTAECGLAVVAARNSAADAADSAVEAGEHRAGAEAAQRAADVAAAGAAADAVTAQYQAREAAGSAAAAEGSAAQAAASAAGANADAELAHEHATEAAASATAAANSATDAATSSKASADSASEAIEAAEKATQQAAGAEASAAAAAGSESAAAGSAQAADASAELASEHAAEAAGCATDAQQAQQAAANSAEAAASTLNASAKKAENNTFTGTNTFNGTVAFNGGLSFAGQPLEKLMAAPSALELMAAGWNPLSGEAETFAEWEAMNPDWQKREHLVLYAPKIKGALPVYTARNAVKSSVLVFSGYFPYSLGGNASANYGLEDMCILTYATSLSGGLNVYNCRRLHLYAPNLTYVSDSATLGHLNATTSVGMEVVLYLPKLTKIGQIDSNAMFANWGPIATLNCHMPCLVYSFTFGRKVAIAAQTCAVLKSLVQGLGTPETVQTITIYPAKDGAEVADEATGQTKFEALQAFAATKNWNFVERS